MVYYICNCMSVHVCLGDLFLSWIAVWSFVMGRNCPFGFLLVVF